MTKIELEKQNRALRDRLMLKERDLQEANARIAALKYRIEELKENPIRALQAAVHANAVSKGWYENPPTFAELLMLVVSEASEALEDYRNGLPVTENHYKDGGKALRHTVGAGGYSDPRPGYVRLLRHRPGGGYPRKARIQQDQTTPPRRKKIIKGA